jgi:hypothetical protein
MFGAGLAGGNWTQIEEMIRQKWIDAGLPVTIYYLPQSLPMGWKPPS